MISSLWLNIKQAISARERALCQLTVCFFKFEYPHLTLKEGSKVISDHTKRYPARDFL